MSINDWWEQLKVIETCKGIWGSVLVTSGEGNGNPLEYFLPGKFHGQRSLVSYNPCGLKESDMTEYLHMTSSYLLLLQNFVTSVQFSRSVMSDSLQPHELQHTRPPCPSPTPRVYTNPCLSSWWCHPTISSSIVSFSSCLQSFPATGFFQMSQLFASGGQSIGVSASTSVVPMNTQDWSPLGWAGWISLQS